MADKHLIIGLGGTGGEVIREYRRQYVEKNNTLDGLNRNIRFLWFDTDEKTLNNHEQWMTNGISIELQENVERFFMNPRQVDLYEVLNSKANYPHIAPWIGSIDNEWDNSKINPKVVANASGQIRKLGRLNFAKYVNSFNNYVTENIRKLIQDKQNQSNVDVHIIAGLAGGTGSGCLIDAIAQVNKKQNNVENVFVYALPPAQNIPANHRGSINNVSLYEANGYAALKELNAFSLASGITEDNIEYKKNIDVLGCFYPYDLSAYDFNKKIRNKNTYQVLYLFTDEAKGAGTTTLSEESRWFRAANWLYIKTLFTNQNLQTETGRIDQGENTSFTPSNLWGQNPNNVATGAMRLTLPKQKLRDYFKNYFLINALKKIQYNNFNENHGFEKKPKTFGGDQEKEIHTLLMEEWMLTKEQLSHDTVDSNAPKIHPKFNNRHANIEEDIRSFANEEDNRIATFGYKGKPVKEYELLDKLDESVQAYINKDFRSVGAVRYFDDWKNQDNLDNFCEYIKKNIINHIFSLNDDGGHKWRPLNKTKEVIKNIRSDKGHINTLKEEISEIKEIYKKDIKKLREDFNAKNSEYKNEFGIFKSRTKRSDIKSEAKEKLIELYNTIVHVEAYTFAIKVIEKLQKQVLVDVEKMVEHASKGVDDLIERYSKQLAEEDPRKEDINQDGIQVYSAKPVIDHIEDSLNKNQQKLEDTIRDLESTIYSNVYQHIAANKTLPDILKELEELGARQADQNLQKEDLKEGLSYDIYNDNLISILYRDFAGDASNVKLQNILKNLYESAAPPIKLAKEEFCPPEEKTIIVLPQLIETKDENADEVTFKQDLESMLNEIATEGVPQIINTSEQDRAAQGNNQTEEYLQIYDEMIVVRLKYNFPMSSVKLVSNIFNDQYNESIKRLKQTNIDAKFLLHIENVSHVPEILPINDHQRVKMYRPYVFLLYVMDAFDKNADILQITKMNRAGTNVDEEKSFFFDNSLEDTLKGSIFYKPDYYKGWSEQNRWLFSSSFYRLKEYTLKQMLNFEKNNLINKCRALIRDMQSNMNQKLFEEINEQYNDIEAIVEYTFNNV